ncbi:MAG: hypothetical protein KA248_15290 [Kiritimatiellae bacterium]|nr:hypothetical protein [Kiritimatiellia bacterium]
MTPCRCIGRILPPAAVLLALAVCSAAAAETLRILRVQHQALNSRRESPALMPDRLGPADPAPAAGAERFRVYWHAGEDGSPPGTVVTFEFRQAYRPLIQTLFIQYPFKVKGERCATFEVAEPTVRRGGRVVAWRVRILRGGRRLAERTSDTWEP